MVQITCKCGAVYEVIDRRDGPDPCIDSHFEYGTRAGYWRIMDLLGRFGAPATLTYYADILKYYRALAKASPRVKIEIKRCEISVAASHKLPSEPSGSRTRNSSPK